MPTAYRVLRDGRSQAIDIESPPPDFPLASSPLTGRRVVRRQLWNTILIILIMIFGVLIIYNFHVNKKVAQRTRPPHPHPSTSAGSTPVKSTPKPSPPIPIPPGQFASLEDRIRKTVHLPFADCHYGVLKEDEPRVCRGPDEVDPGYAHLKEKTGCDMFTVPFVAEDDGPCLKFLTNFDNWKEIVPMEQKYDERTIKFKVKFHDTKLRAILKARQKLFPNEAISEVGSFHADRIMQTNRVPPTTWIDVPVMMINDSLTRYSQKMKLIDQFAEQSHVHTYIEWIQSDLMGFQKKMQKSTRETETVGMSIQLFIADVRPLLDSELEIPWEAHKDTWQAHLSPDNPWNPRYTISFIRQAELAMYDFVLGNGDRSPNKNNFVVGGCRHHHHPQRCGKGPRHPGPPSFVTLDNGMMFFVPLTPDRSPDGPNPLLKKSFCTFERKLLARIKQLDNGEFSRLFLEDTTLPASLRPYFKHRYMAECDKRITTMLQQLDHCIEKFGEDKVVVA